MLCLTILTQMGHVLLYKMYIYPKMKILQKILLDSKLCLYEFMYTIETLEMLNPMMLLVHSCIIMQTS